MRRLRVVCSGLGDRSVQHALHRGEFVPRPGVNLFTESEGHVLMVGMSIEKRLQYKDRELKR